jgi:ATP-dependent exoDNAse (exonuclease V) beta subunit
MSALPDAEKRSKALNPTGNFHLTAPAGSGKTFLLAARYLRLLGLVSHPQQILALTFTNKAAAEMRERVKACLEKAKKGSAAENPAEAELLDYALKALAAHRKLEELLLAGDVLHIRTFHSFCYMIASQAPLEAGIAPGSRLMDEDEQEFFLRETINEALQKIASRQEGDPVRRALMNRLLHLNNSWSALAGEMEDLVKRRGGLLELVQVLSRDRASARLAAGVRSLVETELRALKTGFEAYELGGQWVSFIEETGREGAQAASDLPANIPLAKWEDLPLWICMAETFLTQKGDPRTRLGPKSGFYSGFGETKWCGAIQNLPPETAQRLHNIRRFPAHDKPPTDFETLWDIVVLLHAVLEIYAASTTARRVLDYAALELAALRIFDSADPSDLQLILDQQIRHILVDEFQDTSREQWELLKKLCAGWSEGDGRTLFLVGDPKQSIYGFRKAEVKLFMEAANLGLPIEGGGKINFESLVLDTNFRSQPHLIEWCNNVFGNTVMIQPKAEFDEVPFSPARVSPGTTVFPDLAPIELALFAEWPCRNSAREREARWLARKIARRLERDGRDSQIAILLFSRTHLPVYLEALQKERVPVQVKEGLKLAERPEVRSLWQLCRGIVLPHDDLAWAAQLRSPWFSIDFDRIYAISQEEPPLWIEKISLFSQHDEEVGLFWQALAGARQHLGHEPLADVVESAWLELNGALTVGSKWGSLGLNCCRRFLKMLRDAEQGEPVGTLARFEEILDKAYEPVDPDTATSNVVLSTVHGAKGLEFDSVFIPFLDWDPQSGRKDQPPPYILERAPDCGDFLLATRPGRLTGDKDPLYVLLRKLRSRRQLGEARRLFYVAATRARHELVMSGLVKQKNGKAFSTEAESPLGWLSRHYDIDRLCHIDEFSCPVETDRDCADKWKSSVRMSDGFFVHVEPEPEAVEEIRIETTPTGTAPAEFEREKPVFTVVSPSSLEAPKRDAASGASFISGYAQSAKNIPSLKEGKSNRRSSPASTQLDMSTILPGRGPAPCPPDIWGTLIHSLFAEIGKRGTLPSAQKAAAYIRRLGIVEDASLEVARQALLEVKSCLNDPWLKAFYHMPGERLRVEWPVECLHEGGVLYSGVIDLAAEIDGKWHLIDFKTSRPREGESVEDFIQSETEAYRPQMLGYREICAKLTGKDVSDVQVFIYWTAIKRVFSFQFSVFS